MATFKFGLYMGSLRDTPFLHRKFANQLISSTNTYLRTFTYAYLVRIYSLSRILRHFACFCRCIVSQTNK